MLKVYRGGKEVGETVLKMFFLRVKMTGCKREKFVRIVQNGVRRGRTALGVRQKKVLAVLDLTSTPLRKKEIERALTEHFGEKGFFRHSSYVLEKLLVFRYIVRDEKKRYSITELGKEALYADRAPVREVDLDWLEHFAEKTW